MLRRRWMRERQTCRCRKMEMIGPLVHRMCEWPVLISACDLELQNKYKCRVYVC